MALRSKSALAILLTAIVLSALPARAQIVSVLDEHGQRVFINLAPKPSPISASSKQPLTGPDTSNSTTISSATLKPITPSNPISQNRQTFASNQPSQHNGSLAVGQTGSQTGGQTFTRDRIEQLVQTTAARHSVDPALVRAVMQTESGGNPSAVSRKGAVGLMQLMPQTALDLGVKNIFSAQENLEAGVRYLRTLLEHYGGDLDRALAAYNAGAGAVDRAGGVPKNAETRAYVRKVTNNYLGGDSGKSLALATKAPPVPVAPARSSPAPASAPATSTVPSRAPATVTAIAPPPHRIYRTTDAQGHIVWTND
jgi:hypothetical protein